VTIPLLDFTHECWGRVPGWDQPGGRALTVGAMLFDALLSITCLVVGILGVTSVITIAPAAAYALIGISGGITALWIAMYIKKWLS